MLKPTLFQPRPLTVASRSEYNSGFIPGTRKRRELHNNCEEFCIINKNNECMAVLRQNVLLCKAFQRETNYSSFSFLLLWGGMRDEPREYLRKA